MRKMKSKISRTNFRWSSAWSLFLRNLSYCNFLRDIAKTRSPTRIKSSRSYLRYTIELVRMGSVSTVRFWAANAKMEIGPLIKVDMGTNLILIRLHNEMFVTMIIIVSEIILIDTELFIGTRPCLQQVVN